MSAAAWNKLMDMARRDGERGASGTADPLLARRDRDVVLVKNVSGIDYPRWGALGLNPGVDTGTLGSAPMTVPEGGCELRLNADGVAGLSVDLLDEKFQPIPGFTGGQAAGPDGLDCPVEWKGHAMSELAGQRVRVHVRLQRLPENPPCLYALYLNGTEELT